MYYSPVHIWHQCTCPGSHWRTTFSTDVLCETTGRMGYALSDFREDVRRPIHPTMELVTAVSPDFLM